MKQQPFVLLASNSPRRKELIKELGFDFEVVQNNVDENYPNNLNRNDVPVFLAQQKNTLSPISIKKNQVLLTADTVVVLNDSILEKPKDKEDAYRMISNLSGNTNKVITGVCIRNNSKTISFSVTTKVTFRDLTSEEINHYIDKYSPFDKAGSYGIQEWIGLIGIKKIDGSYTNVVGLPTTEVYEVLKKDFS